MDGWTNTAKYIIPSFVVDNYTELTLPSYSTFHLGYGMLLSLPIHIFILRTQAGLAHHNYMMYNFLQTKHSDEGVARRFVCTICSKRFPSKTDLKVHLARHEKSGKSVLHRGRFGKAGEFITAREVAAQPIGYF